MVLEFLQYLRTEKGSGVRPKRQITDCNVLGHGKTAAHTLPHAIAHQLDWGRSPVERAGVPPSAPHCPHTQVRTRGQDLTVPCNRMVLPSRAHAHTAVSRPRVPPGLWAVSSPAGLGTRHLGTLLPVESYRKGNMDCRREVTRRGLKPTQPNPTQPKPVLSSDRLVHMGGGGIIIPLAQPSQCAFREAERLCVRRRCLSRASMALIRDRTRIAHASSWGQDGQPLPQPALIGLFFSLHYNPTCLGWQCDGIGLAMRWHGSGKAILSPNFVLDKNKDFIVLSPKMLCNNAGGGSTSCPPPPAPP